MVNLRLILGFLAPTLLILCLLQWQGAALVNDKAPHGIVSLELAGKAEKAHSIAESWKQQGKTGTAIGNIRIDFLFIPFYSILLYMTCGSLATINPSRPKRIGTGIAFGCILAGLLDIFENVGMMATLKGNGGSTTATATYVMAVVKFSLVAVALLYIIYSSIRLISGRNGFTRRTT